MSTGAKGDELGRSWERYDCTKMADWLVSSSDRRFFKRPYFNDRKADLTFPVFFDGMEADEGIRDASVAGVRH
eukprot:m.21709 g.21709  ORF g.21709 m.21709 type:complete len:73 (+) comp12508_c1_seq2:281-499(+)